MRIMRGFRRLTEVPIAADTIPACVNQLEGVCCSFGRAKCTMQQDGMTSIAGSRNGQLEAVTELLLELGSDTCAIWLPAIGLLNGVYGIILRFSLPHPFSTHLIIASPGCGLGGLASNSSLLFHRRYASTSS